MGKPAKPVAHLLALASPPTSTTSALASLTYIAPTILYLRDGEVVVYRRANARTWYCRYKLADGTWHRLSTKQFSIEHAVRAACDLYDEARFRQRLGLAHTAQNFAQIAVATLADLRRELDLGRGKSVYASYITCIERYFLPYFAEHQLETLTYSDIAEFELWRNRQMRKQPKASTLNNFASAWNRLLQTAVQRGWLSERAAIPKLSTRGIKSNPRPAFTRSEIDQLLVFMKDWAQSGRLTVEREMRPLLRDYVELLFYTGMRHGTEALGLRWCDVSWHTDKDVRYLRLRVSGKTGERWLIAKHTAINSLHRLFARQFDSSLGTFDHLLTSNNNTYVFRFSNGYQPNSLNGTFRRLMRDSDLGNTETGQMRTLYSLRHTYATLELLEHGTDIHTLSKQMGNSAAIIERHYSKLTATMAANRLA